MSYVVRCVTGAMSRGPLCGRPFLPLHPHWNSRSVSFQVPRQFDAFGHGTQSHEPFRPHPCGPACCHRAATLPSSAEMGWLL